MELLEQVAGALAGLTCNAAVHRHATPSALRAGRCARRSRGSSVSSPTRS